VLKFISLVVQDQRVLAEQVGGRSVQPLTLALTELELS
jgi:hypothetical protein